MFSFLCSVTAVLSTIHFKFMIMTYDLCLTNSPPTDKNLPHPNILTCRDVAMWQICCTRSCRIVVSLSVGGVVQHVRCRCPCSDSQILTEIWTHKPTLSCAPFGLFCHWTTTCSAAIWLWWWRLRRRWWWTAVLVCILLRNVLAKLLEMYFIVSLASSAVIIATLYCLTALLLFQVATSSVGAGQLGIRSPRAPMMSARHSQGPPFRGPPFSAISSSDNLQLGIRLGLGLGLESVVWLWHYQELFPATTMNDVFQNGGPFGMADLNRANQPSPKKIPASTGQ